MPFPENEDTANGFTKFTLYIFHPFSLQYRVNFDGLYPRRENNISNRFCIFHICKFQSFLIRIIYILLRFLEPLRGIRPVTGTRIKASAILLINYRIVFVRILYRDCTVKYNDFIEKCSLQYLANGRLWIYSILPLLL